MPVRGVRRRYLAFEIESDYHLYEAQVWGEFQRHLRLLYGVKGLSKADLRLIEYNPEAMKGVLRCSHDQLTQTRAALAHVTDVAGVPASIRVVRVSGTIKALRHKTGDQ